MAQDRGRRRFESYRNRSQAVSIVVYDSSGKPIQDYVATQIINTVDAVAKKFGLTVSITRT